MRLAISTQERSHGFMPGAPRSHGNTRIVRRRTTERRHSSSSPSAHEHGRTQQARGHSRHVRSAPSAAQMLPPLALFLTLVFQLWIRVGLIESSYELESLRQTAVNRDADVRRLRSELAVISSPRTLAARARKELGMILPPATNVRKLQEK